MEHIRTLKSIQRAEKESVGQRAVDLAVLLEKEYDVPLSFVLTNGAFEAFIEHNKLQITIAKALAATSQPEKRYETIRELLLEGSFPNEMVGEIVDSYQSLGVEQGASLSSIVAAEEAPFVTIILSPNYVVPVENNEGIIINVRGLEELLLAIKECWACLFTPSMQRFREEAGISNRNLNVGVMIQHMPTGEVTGEAWSATKGRADELTVKTYYGAIDIGMHVEKDEFRLTREYLKPVYQSIALQTVMLARDEEDRLGKVPIGTRGEEQTLNDKLVIELGRLAKKASSILECQVKLSFNLIGENINTLFCDRLLLTKGAVKLQSYEDEERIDMAASIKERAEAPLSEEAHIEETNNAVEIDGEIGEESVLQESVVENNEPDVPFEEEIDSSEDSEPEPLNEKEMCEVEPLLDETAQEESENSEEEKEEEFEEDTPVEEEATEEILEIEKEPQEPEPEEQLIEEETNHDEESIFANVITPPESDHVETESDETIIAGDEESGEAEIVGERHENEFVTEESSIDEEEAETNDVASEDEVAEEVEDGEESEEEPEEEPEDDEKNAELTFDEAWNQIREALIERYAARFRNQPPEKLTELYFELSNEIIIPHEELVGKAIKAMEEEEIDQELEEEILLILDDFLEQIK